MTKLSIRPVFLKNPLSEAGYKKFSTTATVVVSLILFRSTCMTEVWFSQ